MLLQNLIGYLVGWWLIVVVFLATVEFLSKKCSNMSQVCGWQSCLCICTFRNELFKIWFFLFSSTVVGWAWNFSDVAFLERNLEKDEETMTKNIQSLGDYPDPVWLLIFAEGTRLNPEKLEASRDFARKRGYPVLRHCKVFIYGLIFYCCLFTSLFFLQILYRFDSQN